MKRYWPLALLLFMTPYPARADGIRIVPDPADRALRVVGRVEDVNSFVANLRLTALGGDVRRFLFLPSDLHGPELISRQGITLIGETRLQEQVSEDFRVKVEGIKKPGTYEGNLRILIPGQRRRDALLIPLTVIARINPALATIAGSNPIQFRLTSWADGCCLGVWTAG